MPSDFGFYEAKKKFEPAPEQRASSSNPISRMAKSSSQPALKGNKELL
jgi:hypothetical protein